MRALLWILFLALPGFAQDVDVAVRPGAIYVETIAGNIAPMERVFFHIVIDNQLKSPIEVEADYHAYGKKVLAAKDGAVVTVRSDVAENVPGETTNLGILPRGEFVQ